MTFKLEPGKEKAINKSISEGLSSVCSFKMCPTFKDAEEGKNLAFLRNQRGPLRLLCSVRARKHSQEK